MKLFFQSDKSESLGHYLMKAGRNQVPLTVEKLEHKITVRSEGRV